MTDTTGKMIDPFLLRIAEAFDRDDTAVQFLREDGDGGFVGGIYRMAREIDRLRAALSSASSPAAGPQVPRSAFPLDHLTAADNKGAVLYFGSQVERDCFLEWLVEQAALSSPAAGSDGDDEDTYKICKTWRALINLRAGEGHTVTLLCDNPDFNGQPNSAIECCGEWTEWEDRRFTGDTIEQAIQGANNALMACPPGHGDKNFGEPVPRAPAADSDGWQPIETAPKDRTPILAINSRLPLSPVVVKWIDDDPLDDSPRWGDAASHNGDNLYYNANYFDYWRPLPAHPTPSTASGGE